MNKFYKGYDDIQASDMFKQRMVRTLQNGTMEKPARIASGFRIKKRTLVAVIAAVVTVLAIGTAAAATIIGSRYKSPSTYLGQTKLEREQNQQTIPDVENVIASMKPETGDYSIVLLPEMEKADELNEWRETFGQPAYSEEDWGWLREIRPEIEEVLLDDSTLAYNVRLHTDHGMSFSHDRSGEGQHVDAVCDGMTYTIEENGKTSTLLYPSGGTIQESVSDSGVTLSSAVNLDNIAEPFPAEGTVRITMQIGIRDADVDSMGFAGLLANLTYSFTFEASAGADVAAPIVTERPLSGTIVLTIEDKEGREYNERVSLDGVVLKETIHYRNTGIYVNYQIKTVPGGWTDAQMHALMNSSFESPNHFGLTVVCAPKGSIDGNEILMPGYPTSGSVQEYVGILPIFPSDYEQIKSVGYEIRIGFRCVSAFNDKPVGEDWHIPPKAGEDYGYNLTTIEQPIAEFDLPMP